MAHRVFALRLRALASLLLALERRRIAHPKAKDYADFQRELQQRLVTSEMVSMIKLRCKNPESPMSLKGLGCVKTRRRATPIERTFVQITVECTKIRKRLRFQLI
jgi:hypothetical protein